MHVHLHHLGRLVLIAFVVLVGILYTLIHPVNALLVVYRIAMVFVGLVNNLATGRYIR